MNRRGTIASINGLNLNQWKEQSASIAKVLTQIPFHRSKKSKVKPQLQSTANATPAATPYKYKCKHERMNANVNIMSTTFSNKNSMTAGTSMPRARGTSRQRQRQRQRQRKPITPPNSYQTLQRMSRISNNFDYQQEAKRAGMISSKSINKCECEQPDTDTDTDADTVPSLDATTHG